MGVGIMSRRMGVMDGKISNHAFGNKLLFTKLPYKDSVLVGRYQIETQKTLKNWAYETI